MSFIKRFLDIKQWTYRELFIFLAAFLVMNLLAPRGFVQWVLVQQDIRRVRNEMIETKERISALEDEIHNFQTSTQIKEQKLRELGYLKPGELSLEFVSPTRKNAAREEKPRDSQTAKAR